MRKNKNKSKGSVELTTDDTARLQEYLRALEEIAQREPERLPAETWDAVMPQIQATGEIPEEYRDRIGVNEITVYSEYVDGRHHYIPEGKAAKGYYDIEWCRRSAEFEELREELLTRYQDVILKALRYVWESKKETGKQASTVVDDLIAALESVTQEKASPRSVAIEKGALMTIGGHIAAYSTDYLRNALNAYSIYKLPSSVDKNKAFDQTGKLNALLLQTRPLEELTEIHTAFLMFVVQAVSLSQTDDGSNSISFYLPEICRELGIDPRTYSKRRDTEQRQSYSDMRFNAMLDTISPFDPLVGRTPDGSFYRLLTFESYEKDSETITISTPYLFKLKAIASQKAAELNRPQLNRLFHGAVVNEPNRAAMELANHILTGVVIRGTRPDYKTYKTKPQISKKTVSFHDDNGKRITTTTEYKTDDQTDDAPAPSPTVTYKVKYSTLIDDCPQLKHELEEIASGKGKAERDVEARANQEKRTASAEEIKQARDKDKKIIPQRINKKLKDVFTAAFRIIEEKSDAPAYYLEFTLPTTTREVKGKKCRVYDVPTKSTLSRNMVITHKGRNTQHAE